MDAVVELFSKELTCPLCGKHYNQPHSFIPGCGHTFCYDCVMATLEGPGIAKSECPTCRQPVWKKDLRRNWAYENVIEKVKLVLEELATSRGGPEDLASPSLHGEDGAGQGDSRPPIQTPLLNSLSLHQVAEGQMTKTVMEKHLEIDGHGSSQGPEVLQRSHSGAGQVLQTDQELANTKYEETALEADEHLCSPVPMMSSCKALTGGTPSGDDENSRLAPLIDRKDFQGTQIPVQQPHAQFNDGDEAHLQCPCLPLNRGSYSSMGASGPLSQALLCIPDSEITEELRPGGPGGGMSSGKPPEGFLETSRLAVDPAGGAMHDKCGLGEADGYSGIQRVGRTPALDLPGHAVPDSSLSAQAGGQVDAVGNTEVGAATGDGNILMVPGNEAPSQRLSAVALRAPLVVASTEEGSFPFSGALPGQHWDTGKDGTAAAATAAAAAHEEDGCIPSEVPLSQSPGSRGRAQYGFGSQPGDVKLGCPQGCQHQEVMDGGEGLRRAARQLKSPATRRLKRLDRMKWKPPDLGHEATPEPTHHPGSDAAPGPSLHPGSAAAASPRLGGPTAPYKSVASFVDLHSFHGQAERGTGLAGVFESGPRYGDAIPTCDGCEVLRGGCAYDKQPGMARDLGVKENVKTSEEAMGSREDTIMSLADHQCCQSVGDDRRAFVDAAVESPQLEIVGGGGSHHGVWVRQGKFQPGARSVSDNFSSEMDLHAAMEGNLRVTLEACYPKPDTLCCHTLPCLPLHDIINTWLHQMQTHLDDDQQAHKWASGGLQGANGSGRVPCSDPELAVSLLPEMCQKEEEQLRRELLWLTSLIQDLEAVLEVQDPSNEQDLEAIHAETGDISRQHQTQVEVPCYGTKDTSCGAVVPQLSSDPAGVWYGGGSVSKQDHEETAALNDRGELEPPGIQGAMMMKKRKWEAHPMGVSADGVDGHAPAANDAVCQVVAEEHVQAPETQRLKAPPELPLELPPGCSLEASPVEGAPGNLRVVHGTGCMAVTAPPTFTPTGGTWDLHELDELMRRRGYNITPLGPSFEIQGPLLEEPHDLVAQGPCLHPSEDTPNNQNPVEADLAKRNLFPTSDVASDAGEGRQAIGEPDVVGIQEGHTAGYTGKCAPCCRADPVVAWPHGPTMDCSAPEKCSQGCVLSGTGLVLDTGLQQLNSQAPVHVPGHDGDKVLEHHTAAKDGTEGVSGAINGEAMPQVSQVIPSLGPPAVGTAAKGSKSRPKAKARKRKMPPSGVPDKWGNSEPADNGCSFQPTDALQPGSLEEKPGPQQASVGQTCPQADKEDLYPSTTKPRVKRVKRARKSRRLSKDPASLARQLVGHDIRVWWPLDNCFYHGVVVQYDRRRNRYTIMYDDGESEVLDLDKEIWELCNVEEDKEGDQAKGRGEDEGPNPQLGVLEDMGKRQLKPCCVPSSEHMDVMPAARASKPCAASPRLNSKGWVTPLGSISGDRLEVVAPQQPQRLGGGQNKPSPTNADAVGPTQVHVAVTDFLDDGNKNSLPVNQFEPDIIKIVDQDSSRHGGNRPKLAGAAAGKLQAGGSFQRHDVPIKAVIPDQQCYGDGRGEGATAVGPTGQDASANITCVAASQGCDEGAALKGPSFHALEDSVQKGVDGSGMHHEIGDHLQQGQARLDDLLPCQDVMVSGGQCHIMRCAGTREGDGCRSLEPSGSHVRQEREAGAIGLVEAEHIDLRTDAAAQQNNQRDGLLDARSRSLDTEVVSAPGQCPATSHPPQCGANLRTQSHDGRDVNSTPSEPSSAGTLSNQEREGMCPCSEVGHDKEALCLVTRPCEAGKGDPGGATGSTRTRCHDGQLPSQGNTHLVETVSPSNMNGSKEQGSEQHKDPVCTTHQATLGAPVCLTPERALTPWLGREPKATQGQPKGQKCTQTTQKAEASAAKRATRNKHVFVTPAKAPEVSPVLGPLPVRPLPLMVVMSTVDRLNMTRFKRWLERQRPAPAYLGKGVDKYTTHLVMPVDENGLCLQRTLKYFEAILRGCWVVSWQWAEDCMTHNRLLQENLYLVQGDPLCLGGPQKGHDRAVHNCPPLFRGLNFFIAHWTTSEQAAAKKKAVEQLIELGGGKLCEHNETGSNGLSGEAAPSHPGSTRGDACSGSRGLTEGKLQPAHSLYVLVEDQSLPVAEVEALQRSWGGSMPVTINWVFDCISAYKILPTEDYIVYGNS